MNTVNDDIKFESHGCTCRITKDSDDEYWWRVEADTPLGYVTVCPPSIDGYTFSATEQHARHACERVALMIRHGVDANAK